MRIHPSQHPLAERHIVLDHPLQPPFAGDPRWIGLALGCFWGAEKVFWQVQGVYTTAVGYAGGHTADPTYREVCGGHTGHAETVLVVYAGGDGLLEDLLDVFWEAHDPTQGMRQGNDIGSQYRSAIYVNDSAELDRALASRDRYQKALTRAGYGRITTEIADGRDFYYAEDYHQQYLVKNPAGYCGLGGTGVAAR